ncbi:MAG: undecaprenyl-diphosphate phosphatase [Clostridia bacterium]|nr:undecaprenyl-diphosphate phosphatase [Clostridia bacterium]
MLFIEILKAFFLGVVQGITEWLPISSTGHMILFDEFVHLNVSEAFMEMFRVVIQFGSILAVVVVYFDKLNPWSKNKDAGERKSTWSLLGKVVLAVIPAGVLGVLFDDLLDTYLYNYITVAATLILYGILFILIERWRKNHRYAVESVDVLPTKKAFAIGCFQVLSLIPGTSRSGSTILGAMLVDVSRPAAAEFSFFLAIPVMLGASGLKILKYVLEVGLAFTAVEWVTMIVGILTAFAVSLVAIRFLTGFVRKHSFAAFGWYRIVLGALVLLYAVLAG